MASTTSFGYNDYGTDLMLKAMMVPMWFKVFSLVYLARVDDDHCAGKLLAKGTSRVPGRKIGRLVISQTYKCIIMIMIHGYNDDPWL